ncbi:MAG: energy-coupling factor transporter transmembrane protein EcfT [Coriobacteriales bacterium]|jgi:energy-coupling factor transport system permease protein|nr:energy-coupling factor transporter transmembrane protein EcfT [Coriobacteriales bacterium]
MPSELLHSDAAAAGRLPLDPRTKLLLTVTVGLVMTSGGYVGPMLVIRPLLAAVPFVLLLVARRRRAALAYGAFFIVASLAELLLLNTTYGLLNFLIIAACGVLLRFLPGVMMGYLLFSTTTVSQFMAAMERMRVSDKISIPLSVMFRFFPTVGEEYGAIDDAMRMRGVRLMSRRPQAMLEYRLVPMMMCTLKIGEELSVSALTRGLGAPTRRTNVCEIGFGAIDVLLIVACAITMVLHFALLFGLMG